MVYRSRDNPWMFIVSKESKVTLTGGVCGSEDNPWMSVVSKRSKDTLTEG